MRAPPPPTNPPAAPPPQSVEKHTQQQQDDYRNIKNDDIMVLDGSCDSCRGRRGVTLLLTWTREAEENKTGDFRSRLMDDTTSTSSTPPG